MGNRLQVSIIIPVYNTASFVKEAVDSIQNQTLKDIEILIIDDGSTDNSLSIAKELAKRDDRIQIYSQENQGQSVARNKGISHAKGEYLYFMDSDDYLEPQTLKCCIDKCKKHNLDFICFDADILNKENNHFLNLTYQRKTFTDEKIVYKGERLLNLQLENHGYSPVPWLNFIRKKYLDEINLSFYPGIIHEDQIFTCLLYIQANRVMCIHQNFFKRRIRENSTMTQRFSMKNMSAYFTVTDELLKFASLHPEHQATIDKYLSQMLNAAVWLSWKMPFKNRLYIARQCLVHYKRYVSTHHLLLLLFKSFLKKKQ